jgi:DNA polymerase-1
MIDVHAALAKAFPTARMILTVHDELLFEAAARQADDVSALVSRSMANAVTLNVPLVVDVGYGETWKDAKP